MKFKLDENLGQRCAQLFIDAGHDCSSVLSQGLAGSSDPTLIMHCLTEARALVTLDLDFANPQLRRAGPEKQQYLSSPEADLHFPLIWACVILLGSSIEDYERVREFCNYLVSE